MHQICCCKTNDCVYKPDQYKIKTFWDFASVFGVHLPADRIVRLRSADGTELPDPGLLEFHLAIANVLHTTKMGEELNRFMMDELEEEECSLPNKQQRGASERCPQCQGIAVGQSSPDPQGEPDSSKAEQCEFW